MDFNGPIPPLGMHFPGPAHHAANIVIWVVAVALALGAARELFTRRSPLALILLIGGAIALFNEPVDDILGLVWHPRIGQDTVLNTIGPVPMWGLPTYIIFFGAIPWLLLRELERHQFTLKKFWIGIGLTFAADLLIELPLLQTNLYAYYAHGSTPMTVARFPLYWLMINTTGPVLCASILYAVPGYFRGYRAPLLVLLPIAADAACSIVVGLPVYSALHAPSATGLVRWIGAGVSFLIGLAILDAESRFICHRTALKRAGTLPAVATNGERRMHAESLAGSAD